MNKDTTNMLARLERLGITPDDALALRRISMTLHRWYELECGTGDGCIERDEATGVPYWYNANSRYLGANDRRAYSRIPDRERGALKRLGAIMARYPGLSYHVQTDPRGCALYLLRPGDVPEGEDPDAYYSRGVPVYK
jgi:hypothetical protein